MCWTPRRRNSSIPNQLKQTAQMPKSILNDATNNRVTDETQMKLKQSRFKLKQSRFRANEVEEAVKRNSTFSYRWNLEVEKWEEWLRQEGAEQRNVEAGEAAPGERLREREAQGDWRGAKGYWVRDFRVCFALFCFLVSQFPPVETMKHEPLIFLFSMKSWKHGREKSKN